jgi:fumarate hydratase class II
MEAEKPKIGELIGRETAMNNASMSAVSVCATKLLGAQTQRSHEHSSIGMDLIQGR